MAHTHPNLLPEVGIVNGSKLPFFLFKLPLPVLGGEEDLFAAPLGFFTLLQLFQEPPPFLEQMLVLCSHLVNPHLVLH